MSNNINFGINLLPSTNKSVSLGSSTKKWDNVYAKTLNGKNIDFLGIIHRFTTTIPITGWTQAPDSLYTVTIQVQGIQSTDDCEMTTLEQTGVESTDSDLRTAFNYITRIAAGTNSITVYAKNIPNIAIPIRITVIR